ncbi:MAG: bifunctional folylpolyglutamate synthase/dihydrofolate synthase, partial [Bacteroidetes bacterium]|nr:bifunctional folylpolyglutamate synthase/dihydrofolate synthase [Bacteroidota bacterium]
MNYQQTIDFLFSQLPIYQRQGKIAYRADLGNITDLCNAMGNPQNKFKSIHVAGTNGKGSVCNMLSAILQSSGLKVGLYTSPHLQDFRERVRINGKMISKKAIVDFVAQQKEIIETLDASFFEMTVALAFHHFSQQQVDVAIIEVGLGGRLDSTNIIKPLLSVITNISKDHTNHLGNTIT